jgi:hypothetical protein
MSFFSRSWLLLTLLTGLNWGAIGDSEKTHNRQKVGSGVLGARVEMHNPHLLLFSIFIL